MEDQSLISACKRGESWAQKQIYENYASAMLSICLRYSSEKETARDLLHDGFFTVFTKIHTYSGQGSFPNWMKKIFVNTSLEYVRNYKERIYLEVDSQEISHLPDNETTIIEQLSADELFTLIIKLPDGYRTVFNLYAIEGYSHVEIAQMFNIHENTSRSQYMRARRLLQEMISERELTHLTLSINEKK